MTRVLPQQTIEAPQPELLDRQGEDFQEWIVVVYDNDTNTYDQVIGILMEATGCPLEEAQLETWEIDHLGRSVVHHGDQQECERAAAVIRRIGIEVAVKEL